MDKLFKKTVTKPHIYYLPLTDEEAAARDRVKPRPPFLLPPSVDIRRDRNIINF
ncbi:hypothetical protein PPL_07762 [Heterostelium album PN500]|uniref:Uncharacterized protein n=1 Tax=Heterostelium pallidum (strain ATCC 26659 / Pp 5 / PN500) TaxID=670386 RepID=D3BGW0_HETP5|nr:hypothetical protein PPL_07762 [Heterostelium album PN500]EFA79344.1 hypothetical protein PPL_07762 [Heterostelium album PN500]|eukprot:XP_020431465.1 hypothetical protein PPL_07762 [Heterostelium album PN500]